MDEDVDERHLQWKALLSQTCILLTAEGIPEQYINPDESVPTRGSTADACGCDEIFSSLRYVCRKTPYAFGKPHTTVSMMNAPAS
jgi:ribonucleotide monophosphatase NagD (HAD superfamily)